LKTIVLCKSAVCFILTFICISSLFGQNSSFERGEDLFLRNKPYEAVSLLERALAVDPANIKAGLYLGMSYEQLGRLDDAIALYRKLLPHAGPQTALVAYNLGNVYFNKGVAVFAEQFYTQAITFDPGYSSAYLNRANTRIKTGSLDGAVSDYELYLELEPRSVQRPRIEQMIALIKEEIIIEANKRVAAAEEAARAVEEAARAAEQAAKDAEQAAKDAAEAAMLAEEAARLEKERRQRLLDEVAASLQASSEDTQGFAAGSESVSGYDSEFELE
jgi:tetratricopeptide (TPR) repeat protein